MILYYYIGRKRAFFSKKIFLWIISYALIVSFIGYTQNQTMYFSNHNSKPYVIQIQTTHPIHSITQNPNNRTRNKMISLIPIKHYKNFLLGSLPQNNTIVILPSDKIIAITFPSEKPTFKTSRLYQDWEKILNTFQERFPLLNSK